MARHGTRASGPTGRSGAQPEALFPGAETILAAAAAAVIKEVGPTAGTALVNVWREKEPCLVQMKASWADTDAHYITLKFTNVSAHGVYLESITVVDPKSVTLDVATDLRPEIQFGSAEGVSWVGPDQLLPCLLRSDAGHGKTIACRMRDGEDGGRQRASLTFRGAVTLEYECSQLDQPKPVRKRITVQLRERGPAGF